MIARRAFPVVRRAASRQFSALPTNSKPTTVGFYGKWYEVFGSSTAGYATWLVMGIVLGELFTGALTDTMWRSSNYGKTFDTVDWAKFDPSDDDEEEEDDDE